MSGAFAPLAAARTDLMRAKAQGLQLRARCPFLGAWLVELPSCHGGGHPPRRFGGTE